MLFFPSVFVLVFSVQRYNIVLEFSNKQRHFFFFLKYLLLLLCMLFAKQNKQQKKGTYWVPFCRKDLKIRCDEFAACRQGKGDAAFETLQTCLKVYVLVFPLFKPMHSYTCEAFVSVLCLTCCSWNYLKVYSLYFLISIFQKCLCSICSSVSFCIALE